MSYDDADSAHSRFRQEWTTMSDDEKLRWLLAGASNSQVRSEGFKSGPFFQKVRKELKPLLTDQWLFENDTDGVLHDREENPVGQAPP